MKTHAHFGGELMCSTRPNIGGYPENVPLETFWKLPAWNRCKRCIKRLTGMGRLAQNGGASR